MWRENPASLRTDDFDFELPAESIAQYPLPGREESRLLVLPRKKGQALHTTFSDLPGHLRPGDLLVLNDTRVFPARLLGRRVPSGGAVECLLLARIDGNEEAQRQGPGAGSPKLRARSPGVGAPSREAAAGSRSETWQALVHPGQKLKPGAKMLFEQEGRQLHGEILSRHFYGRRTVRLWTEEGTSVQDTVDAIGHIPLPPYIHRKDEALDRDRYQTVYARSRGSIAAPTSGLHFTPRLLDELERRGIERVSVTLDIGYGTFKPVRVERVEDHQVDAERFTVSPAAADALTRARGEGRRIVAVGTTTTRALESLETDDSGAIAPASGSTDLFIRPGHQFRFVQGLVTNFHLPRSSLLMLVAAFAGRERILAAYREAVALGYRFYSYGDAMLIV
jgi:S-adenosylmethionine:tRNA ribosyltransferase-isomerase